MPETKKKKEEEGLPLLKKFLGQAVGIIIAVFLTVIAILVTITIFAHKARLRCANNHGAIATSILISTILMWVGGFLPKINVVVGPLSFISTIVLIIVGYSVCKQ